MRAGIDEPHGPLEVGLPPCSPEVATRLCVAPGGGLVPRLSYLPQKPLPPEFHAVPSRGVSSAPRLASGRHV